MSHLQPLSDRHEAQRRVNFFFFFSVLFPLLCSLFGIGTYSMFLVCPTAISLFSVKIVVGCIWHNFLLSA